MKEFNLIEKNLKIHSKLWKVYLLALGVAVIYTLFEKGIN